MIELGLADENFTISQNTVKSRITNGTTTSIPGPKSPAAAIEPILLAFANYRQIAGQPLKPSETLAFANSLISGGSKVKASLKAFHNANHQKPNKLLGPQWYRGFVTRNAEILSSGRGVRKHNARKEWTTYDNIKKMYDLVYAKMVHAGIAEELAVEDQYFIDANNNLVDTEKEAAGHKCELKLKHPSWLLFGDEVGTDTSQEEDGNISGQTYLQFANQRIELTSSKASGRFTVIGLTAATGEPVMCVVIMAAQELGIADAMGFDYLADSQYDTQKTLEENSGPGKALPGLPTCTFHGKTIPALLAHTKKGSITSEILTKILKRLDELDVFERTADGPTPMLLLDGHDSQLQLEFLEYVNKDNQFGKPNWKACIGLPNGTSVWQVGDSKQQNGSWKTAMTRLKDELVLFKQRNFFESVDFKRHDIIPLIN